MKAKLVLSAAIVLAIGGGIFWAETHRPPAPVTLNSKGQKPLYYTCSMDWWIRSDKPGKCPVCGMNLTPVYPTDVHNTNSTNSISSADVLTLNSESIGIINVQTEPVERQPVRRTMHFSGEIVGNSPQAAWFEFIAYQRDFEWLKPGQIFHVAVEGVPDKVFTAEIKSAGANSFGETNFDMMTSSLKLRAKISDSPVVLGDFGKGRLFNGLHAEAHVLAETEPMLAIPRSAVISRGFGATVFVAQDGGHYASRSIELGRIGDELAEVASGLKSGEKVVTTGNILMDSEAQLTTGK